jgi:hypothetical protein
MADQKLSALSSATTPLDGDELVLVTQGGTSLSAPVSEFGGRVLLEEIVNASAGEFDFDSIPATYNRLTIEGVLRSDATATSDSVYMFINTDTTVANYHRQNNSSYDAAHSVTEAAAPSIGSVAADSSPANVYTDVTIHIINYAGTYIKNFRSDFVGQLASATQVIVGPVGTTSSITAAITRLRIQTDNHSTDQLFGTLRLYGEM